MLRLSQGHLNLLAECPPRFARTYLWQTGSLPDPEIENSQTWGKQFHLLMQQRELGLPIDSLLAENSELDRSIEALISAAPELFTPHLPHCYREAEYTLTLSHGNYLLTTIYDLLVATDNKAQIIDWKTYALPQKKEKLATNWQTRLYLYVLAETSEYEPEQISMTYWFVKPPQKPQSLTFSYSKEQHQETKEALQTLLDKLDLWLHRDCDRFPHRSDCEANCRYFQQMTIDSDNTPLDSTLISLEEIEEIPI